MGYTHYWEGKAEATPELLENVKRVMNMADVPLANWAGDEGTLPEVNTAEIRFNGVGDGHCETFVIEFGEDTDFGFCKTGRAPYDVVVVAILELVQAANADTFRWSSDGTDEDHKAGRELAFSAEGWL